MLCNTNATAILGETAMQDNSGQQTEVSFIKHGAQLRHIRRFLVSDRPTKS